MVACITFIMLHLSFAEINGKKHFDAYMHVERFEFQVLSVM